jgi:hypothetical protein
MTTLFSENFENLAKLIFDFYDFDKDGIISREDVRVVLSYIPLNIQKYSKLKLKFEKEEFKDRVESQDELHAILEKCFKMSEFLNKNKFLNIVENICSDPFLFILIFLLDKKPFSKTTIKEFQGRKLNTNLIKVNRTPILQSRLIASPNLQSKFSPSVTIKKSPMMTKRLTLDNADGRQNNKDESKNYLMQFARKEINNASNNPKSVLMKYTAANSAKDKARQEEEICDTDENVSILNIPVNRKKRNDLKNLEKVEYVNLKLTNYSDLPITPAIKQKVGKEIEGITR